MNPTNFKCELKAHIVDGEIENIEIDGQWVSPKSLFGEDETKRLGILITAMKFASEGIVKLSPNHRKKEIWKESI